MVENDLGNVVTRAGEPKEAQRLYRAAVDEYRKLPEGTYVEMAAPLSNLGFELIRADKPKDAEPYIREGLALRQSVLGNAHPDTAGSFLRMADLLTPRKIMPGGKRRRRNRLPCSAGARAPRKTSPFPACF